MAVRPRGVFIVAGMRVDVAGTTVRVFRAVVVVVVVTLCEQQRREIASSSRCLIHTRLSARRHNEVCPKYGTGAHKAQSERYGLA